MTRLSCAVGSTVSGGLGPLQLDDFHRPAALPWPQAQAHVGDAQEVAPERRRGVSWAGTVWTVRSIGHAA